jgi:hypothetical protein
MYLQAITSPNLLWSSPKIPQHIALLASLGASHRLS